MSQHDLQLLVTLLGTALLALAVAFWLALSLLVSQIRARREWQAKSTRDSLTSLEMYERLLELDPHGAAEQFGRHFRRRRQTLTVPRPPLPVSASPATSASWPGGPLGGRRG